MLPIVFALFASAASAGQTPPDDAIFKTAVSLVRVDAGVEAADGQLIGGLRKEDFRVFDEGKEQTILHFAAEEEPLDLVLLFDTSGSLQYAAQMVAERAREALLTLRAGDRVAVMAFTNYSHLLQPFTEDMEKVERSIKESVLREPFAGETRIQRAAGDAALLFQHERRTGRRRVVLVITDNVGAPETANRQRQIVRDFWEADAVLNGLVIPNPRFDGNPHLKDTFMGDRLALGSIASIAEETGGNAVVARSGPVLQDALKRIRTRYALYYRLPQAKPGSARKVRLELTPELAKRYPKLKVRARAGYIAPKGESQ